MATGEKRGKKRNFSDTEIETLVGEVEARKTVLFGGHSSGVTNKKKQCEWQSIASAVNCVSGTERTVAELKKKWSDLKVEAKRKLSSHRQSVAATGGGPCTADLTSVDSKIAAIIGEVSVCGIVSEKEGDTDVTETTEEQVLPESEAVNEQEVQGEGFSDADAQRPAQSSAPSASGTSKSGRVLTDAVLQLQRETINAVNGVADELRQMREVMQEIAQSLKDAVKT
ncbi:myb-related transcription factor, partner of profilin-like [Cyprinus carpio]|uniref:Myb-related transcription factor, partner of profilin-like n=2 Tax=Cyprinus carpio TaxID=7962 RepID=A0A8C1CYP9_CYPCA|nr:myb-related transcription factor, partner of profilin-like [Cyprinus carpio]